LSIKWIIDRLTYRNGNEIRDLFELENQTRKIRLSHRMRWQTLIDVSASTIYTDFLIGWCCRHCHRKLPVWPLL